MHLVGGTDAESLMAPAEPVSIITTASYDIIPPDKPPELLR